MRLQRLWWITLAIALAGTTAWYATNGRRRVLTWGASEDEARRHYAGDELLPDATLVSTRAVRICAPPDDIWPWLIQMGSGRAGAYSYDWIENLFGLDMHSADDIVAEWQQVDVGDEFPLGKGAIMIVRVLDAPRAFVIQSGDGRWVWEFALIPDGAGTRLISRNRIQLDDAPRPMRIGYPLVMEPGSLLMERKMLLGIRERVETRSPVAPPTP